MPPHRAATNGLPEFDYPFHDRDILVTACGRICLHRKKINISTVFAGQRRQGSPGSIKPIGRGGQARKVAASSRAEQCP